MSVFLLIYSRYCQRLPKTSSDSRNFNQYVINQNSFCISIDISLINLIFVRSSVIFKTLWIN